MSETINKMNDEIKNIKIQTLTNLYNQCTPDQQKLFNRMYTSLEKIPDDRINWAIQQCERTIATNNKLKLLDGR